MPRIIIRILNRIIDALVILEWKLENKQAKKDLRRWQLDKDNREEKENDSI